MGLSCGEHQHDFDKSESEVPLINETRESRQRGCDMDIHHHQHHHHHPIEFDVDFWPVEHPMEPQDEDRPVKCPIPTSSSVINDGKMNEERNHSESLQKRAEHPRIMNKEGVVIVDAEPPIRAVRKRHHTLTNGDHVITPSLRRMPSLPPLPSQNVTIFQMLQQLDEFEC